MEPLKRAIDTAGSIAALAELLGVTRQAVEKWEQNGIPANRALDIERVSSVPRHELLPHLFDGYTRADDEKAAV